MTVTNRLYDSNVDRVHMDIDFTTTEGLRSSPLEFRKNRVTTILHQPKNFNLTVTGIKIPLLYVPMFLFRQNAYFITLSYDGTTVIRILQYIPTNINQPPDGGNEYSYQNFINSLNNAFDSAFTTLKTAVPATPANLPPRFVFDPATQLISMYIEPGFVTGPISIGMNYKLFQFIPNLCRTFFQSLNFIEYKPAITLTNQVNIGGIDYIKVTQTYPTVQLWPNINTIILETNTIPVRTELAGGQLDIQVRRLADFLVPLSEVRTDNFFYLPQGPLRIRDLTEAQEMRSIDFKASYLTRGGRVVQMRSTVISQATHRYL